MLKAVNEENANRLKEQLIDNIKENYEYFKNLEEVNNEKIY